MRSGARHCFDGRWLQQRLAELTPTGARSLRYCVAWSGGLDSTALLAALVELRDTARATQRQSFALRALHVDHHLQPASQDFRRYCRGAARRWGVPLAIRDAWLSPARGESIEQLARIARRALFAAALRPGELLLTAQHEDDQLETVLLQLLRGAGVAGLAAMGASQPCGAGRLLRPLLPVNREALRVYLQGRGITWVDDPSNADPRFDRNYLRLSVLPALYARWPAAAHTISRSARLSAVATVALHTQAQRDCAAAADGAQLDLAVVRRLSPARQRSALRYWIGARGLPVPDERRLAEVQQMTRLRADAKPLVCWPGGSIRRHQDLLYALPAATGASQTDAALPAIWNWRRDARLQLVCGGSLALLRDPHGDVDLARLPAALLVRGRAGGERLQAQSGHRDVKELLRVAGVPSWERASLPLVFASRTRRADAPPALLAIADLWIAEVLRCSPKTTRRGRFVWQRE